MTTATNRTASYRGRTYRLLFVGETKYGRRAHLQFFDGSKDFWVDAVAVQENQTYDPQKFNGYGASRGGYRRACITGGNCSSFGSGRSCGGHDCDGH